MPTALRRAARRLRRPVSNTGPARFDTWAVRHTHHPAPPRQREERPRMADLITAGDLAAVPGTPGTTEEKSYAARRASTAVIRHWTGTLPAEQWVKDIAIDVAVDYLHNPTGTTSVTRSIDDASRTDRYDGPRRRAAAFELTDAEIRQLSTPGRARRRVGSIRTHVPI